MGRTSELLSLLKTGNSDAARRLIAKLKKAGKKKALTKELNVPDDNGQTVIHFCAAQNFVEFLQDLAELGASVDLADNRGYTPLHLAATSGRTSAVTSLIALGADPNISSRSGDTALHLACNFGHATSVEALVAQNANCTMLNVSGHTPLDLACQNGHAQVVSLLLRSGQFSASYLQRSDMPHTALMLAAKQGHNECIGLLIKHGFDVNRKLPGGNGGTALHEAALHGKVDTVRYLLQFGVDVQKTNAQGLTALDIVNMYTDPRTASIMKQVLTDALAQQARTRIAQQHAGQQTATSRAHHTPPVQSAGFSYFPHPGQQQPAASRHVAEDSTHHRPSQHPGSAYRQTGHPYHPAGHTYQPSGHSYQHTGHSHPPTGHSHQSTGHSHQPTGHSHQPTVHSHQTTAHSHQLTGRSSQATGHSHQPTGYSRSSEQSRVQSHQNSTNQSHLYTGQSTAHAHTGQPSSQQQAVGYSAHREDPAAAIQPSPPHNVQHIYPKPGTPETVRKAPGIGGDLAAIIAARAASRKPIVTSPTRKEFSEADDDRITRSMTLGSTSGEPAVQQARTAAQRRRSSVSDRSSGSPEHVTNPPMLPRRQQAGPPSFKPVPPPVDEPRIQQGHVANNSEPVDTEHRPQLRKPHPRAPPPPPSSSADDELMAKLLRRQNKITEAEQAAPEQPPQPPAEEEEEEKTVLAKPPPPPMRKTPSLNTAQSPPQTSGGASGGTSAVPPQAVSTETGVMPVKTRKIKPPTPKPKEVEPEMSPWQQELAARKARLAEADSEPERPAASQDEQSPEKESSPAPIPKPAPKPRQTQPPPPTTIPAPIPAPVPAVVPQELPPPSNAMPDHSPPSLPPQPPPVSTQQPEVQKGEPVIVVDEPERPALPAEVSTLVAASSDQLSRSTSMSSLTTGTASPQLSHVEHMPILEWLTSYKLADYAPVLERNGYETTELLVGITHEELQDMGINKIGHRKKLISALSNWPMREHFFQVKPESVSVWLSVLHLSQYEQVMLDAGYDDIDFICDIALDDLHDVGISKKGHVKRLLQGIGELTEFVKSGLPFPSPHRVPITLESSLPVTVEVPPSSLPAPPTEPCDDTLAEEDLVLPPPRDWTDRGSSPEKVDFGRMKSLLEMKMGVQRVPEEEPRPSDGQPDSWTDEVPPELPPKRNVHRPTLAATQSGSDQLDRGNSYSVEDISTALGENVSRRDMSELERLNAALQGLTSDGAQPNQPSASVKEQDPDQLLADIDDMLADLTTHLDVMIPGSSTS